MKSKRVAFKWLPVAVAALPLCALVYYYTTHRRPVDNAKTATSTSVTTTTAEQRRSRSTAAIVAYLSHTYTCAPMGALSPLFVALFSFSVFALSTNQTSRCFVRALYHLLLILLILLLLFFASSSCCCNVVMEVKRRAYMKTSLQFNVRTWHSAATSRWPFRYSNWWLSFLRSVLIRSSTHSPSLSQSPSLLVPLSYEREPHTICLSTRIHMHTNTHFLFNIHDCVYH